MKFEDIEMFRILQCFNQEKIKNIDAIIAQELDIIGLHKIIKPGMSIGIAVGSRGINKINIIVKAVIDKIKKNGGIPFILPAMGSHGNANINGQVKILESFGITEDSMQVPIRATMEVSEIGKMENGIPVFFDKIALLADGIIIINRIKPHTVFKAKIESGLCKMLAVGLGNHLGATAMHSLGPKFISDNVVNAAKIILEKAPVILGLGIVENAYDEVKNIKAVLPKDFYEIDRNLLIESKNNMPTLPVKNIDILIVQEMGKDISGAGLDTNIVGGVKAYEEESYFPPVIDKLVLLDLTDQSYGNAIGVSIADIITERLFKKIDFEATYENVITCGYLDRAKIPITLKTDKMAIETALKTIFHLPEAYPRIIIMRNTLITHKLLVSKPIFDEIKDKKEIKIIDSNERLRFDEYGNLKIKI